MKRKVMLYLILFLGCYSTIFGQSSTFPYTDTTTVALLGNNEWLRAAAQNLLSTDQSALTSDNKIDIAMVLGDDSGGLQLVEESTAHKLSKAPAVWMALCRSYFKAGIKNNKNSFLEEMNVSFKALNIPPENRDNLVAFSMPKRDPMMLEQIFEQFLKIKLRKPEKVLATDEVKKIMAIVASLKVSETYGGEIRQLAAEVNKGFDKATQYWESVQYPYSESDKPQIVLAANMQCFDKNQFPENQIWKNEKEIPDNGIDDDHNGVTDDIYGVIFNRMDDNKASPIYLDRKKDLPYFKSVIDINHAHGTMTVELMLKDNPTARVMGIEHSQYDLDWDEVISRFTKDIAHNRWLIDSLVTERLRVWQQAIQYIKANKVRVVEINSMGLSLHENGIALTGCGKDETGTKKFWEEKFWQLVNGFTKCFIEAPNTLFVLSAGNDSVNTKDNPALNNQIHLPNTIVVGALYKDLLKTKYSNYGPDVDVFAPGHFKLKSKNTYPESSGTSAASPVVCNTAIKLFSLNPELTPEQVKRFIISTSDKDLYEKGINIINPLRAVELMKREKG
ncbi:MAG: S8 family serine peptidase [Chitinophagaceae bacterium]|nr:S8 family serine peptidase [Chitinophagaceae bacterium]